MMAQLLTQDTMYDGLIWIDIPQPDALDMAATEGTGVIHLSRLEPLTRAGLIGRLYVFLQSGDLRFEILSVEIVSTSTLALHLKCIRRAGDA